MNLDAALQTFLAESRDLLGDMEGALLAVEHADDRQELVNAIFRAAHTIKGSSGMFGLDHIVTFTHGVESVLDQVRGGTLQIGDQLVSLLLACGDHVGAMIDAVAAGELAESAHLAQCGAPLAERLRAFLPVASAASAVAPGGPAPAAAAPACGAARWRIGLRFGPDVLRNGMDPLSFIRYLETLGSIEAITTLTTAIPPAAQMDPESCYLGFDIDFASQASRASIDSVFDFVRDDCAITIAPLAEPESLPAPARPKPHKEAHAQDSHSIRVDADKLDQLINLVGELIIAGAGAQLIARRSQAADLYESMSKVASLVEGVRDSALQLRMVKIGATFNRFQRVVHDVSRELGKDIELVVSGEDTELDKTVVEKIGDPLTHLVRNAMDHGIEAAAQRAAQGKSAHGTVRLDAYHDSGSIVIAVSDDGGGLRREKILAKAIERGLAEPGRHLADDEVFKLIFEPGFSTAEQVSQLSGRGVGLDVVKRNITELRGTVAVHSEEGRGTTVTVRLPLTLAIIDGFLVEVGKSVFAIPLDMIEECVAYSAEPGHDYTNLRGEVLPFIRLGQLFGVESAHQRRQNIVVLKHAGQKAGLVVDRLLGESQTVIKPLAKLFSRVKCISGSTILGSGEVALILDVPALVQQAGRPRETGNNPALAA